MNTISTPLESTPIEHTPLLAVNIYILLEIYIYILLHCGMFYNTVEKISTVTTYIN